MEVPVSKFVHCTLIVILITSVCVKANYNLSISIYSYSNPSHKCATCTTSSSLPSERGCCDNHDNLGTCSEDDFCDPGFYFCLLPLNGRTSRDCVDHTRKLAPLFQENASTITASRGQFLGLDVPFMLEGISDEWRGVKLYIWVHDADFILPNGTDLSLNDDDTIDEFYINITSLVGVPTLRKFYNGINNFVTLELAFQVTCAQYYYGDNCENLNECELNSVTCNGRGQCEDEVNSYTCICQPRYAGSQCEDLNDCYINSVTCSGNGQCVDGVNSYTCECDPGYTGSLCEHERDHSVTDMPMVCSQSFQLLLGPVNDCQEWRFDNHISKANSIISTLIGEISCPGCTIINPEFSCKDAYTQSILFRATISGNMTLSCNRSVQSLSDWIQSGSASILVETNRLEVESSCEVSISSKSDPLICGANVDTTNSQGATDVKGENDDSNGMIYTVSGVVIALAVTVAAVIVIVIWILCVRNSKRRNATTSSARIQESRTKALDRSTRPVPTIQNNISYKSSVKKHTKGAKYLGPATRSPSPPHEYEYMYSKPRDGTVSNTEFESQNSIGKSTYSKKKIINVSPLDLQLARKSQTPQFQTSKFNDDYEDVLY